MPEFLSVVSHVFPHSDNQLKFYIDSRFPGFNRKLKICSWLSVWLYMSKKCSLENLSVTCDLLIFTLTCCVKVQTREFHRLKSIPIRNFLSNHFCTRKHPRFHYIHYSNLRNSLNTNIFPNNDFFKKKFQRHFIIFKFTQIISKKNLLMRQQSVQKSFDIFQSTRFVLLYIHTMVLSRSKF